MKKGKRPLSIIIIIISSVAFAGVMFTEDLRAIIEEMEDSTSAPNNITDEDAIEFSPDKCSVTEGRWIFNNRSEPVYSDVTCPYVEQPESCLKNGRPDKDYLFWEWRPDDCNLPRFNAAKVLKKLRGKRMMFVGDSLQRQQWLSFVCLVQSHIPHIQKSMDLSRPHSIFKAKEYNATIEFYWAPFLVESNSDMSIVKDTSKRILRLDSIKKHAQYWIGVDIIVFNTYVWWMSGQRIKSMWGSFGGMDGYEELDVLVAYRLGLKTWANWVDATLSSNTTRVFFITMSPTHLRSEDWNHKKGAKCYNETRPVTEKGYWGSGSDKSMMEVVSTVVKRMKFEVTFINITQLSEYRIDGHVSVYTEPRGKKLTEGKKGNQTMYADCIHWCLPGVPDTWNQILYAYLL